MSKGGLRQDTQILFLHCLQLSGDTCIDAALTDCINHCPAVSCLLYTGGIHARGLSDCLMLLTGILLRSAPFYTPRNYT